MHNTVGIDLVAMSVNDALCCGAEPLFFLDYVAMPKDDPELLEQIVEGVAAGCIEADCALLGGETAILPDLYAPGDYDLAGLLRGRRAAEASSSTARAIEAGDVVLGLASTGLHSNGYSLARKIVFEVAGLGVDDFVEELGATVGEALLDAHADLRPPGPPGVELLSGEERGARHRPHHRRRPAREPGADRAAGRPGRHRPRQLARAAGLHLAPAAGRGRAGRDGPGVQHGHRPGAGRRPRSMPRAFAASWPARASKAGSSGGPRKARRA